MKLGTLVIGAMLGLRATSKVVSKGRTSYGRDGTTRTLTWTAFDDKGLKFENQAVFHRQ